MKKKRYRLFIYATVLVTIILIVVLFPKMPVEQNNLKIEFIKDLIQLSLIVIIGGILINEYNNERDQEKKQNGLKKELYLDMIHSYFKTKKVRRTLEAAVTDKERTANRTMLYSTYKSQMHDLIDAQLEYEFYRDQISFFIKANTFRNKETGRQLKQNACYMEKYLNNIIERYQKSEPGIDVINVSELRELNDFIFDTDIFKKEFSGFHKNSVELFLGEILDVKQDSKNFSSPQHP